MNSKLIIVPPQFVHKYWSLAGPLLQKAIDKGNGEFELNDLRYVCSRGEQQLLLIMVDDQCVCAFTTIQYNFPRYRSMYISYIGGSQTTEGWADFLTWTKNQGCDRVNGSATSEGIARLWKKQFGFEKKYINVELNLTRNKK
tara:strand:- start:366 stop:791 length:426 start_codon:yes stop_codon:yes gene_type:complete